MRALAGEHLYAIQRRDLRRRLSTLLLVHDNGPHVPPGHPQLSPLIKVPDCLILDDWCSGRVDASGHGQVLSLEAGPALVQLSCCVTRRCPLNHSDRSMQLEYRAGNRRDYADPQARCQYSTALHVSQTVPRRTPQAFAIHVPNQSIGPCRIASASPVTASSPRSRCSARPEETRRR